MSVHIEIDGDRIATLTFDLVDRSTNVINQQLLEPFASAISQLESESGLKGVILASAKRDFIAGADLEVLAKAAKPEDVVEATESFKSLLRRLESLPCPVVAAINGTALGGGYEVALAAHHRVANNDSKIKIGLPEVTLGLLPGGGGTQRLPRMIGIQNALPFLLEGKQLDPARALAAGLVDELADDPSNLLTQARAWIEANPNAKQPWDERKFRFPGGDSKHPQVAQMWAIAPSMLNAKTHGNYRAPRLIMASVFEGSLLDFETASRIESRYFAALACGQESKNMINAFWTQLNAIKKGASRPQGFEHRPFQRVGILGAGMMGAGIAYVTALAGIEVVLKDVGLDRAEHGKDYSKKLLNKRKRRGRISAERVTETLDRIMPTESVSDLAGCELVIEAVFENRELKARVTQETEAVLEDTAIFASNTSTLPITGLAEASRAPNQFIGLHFFSPVDKMPLVEIIVGKETSDQTLALAFDFVMQIGKTPIVVQDSRGFYTSRVFSAFVMEGMAMLAEGQPAWSIEAAGLKAGMPVGPLAVSDEVSLSLMLAIMEQTARDLAAEGKPAKTHPADAVVRAMVRDWDRPGKKAGRGFYDYPADQPKHLWPGLSDHFSKDSELLDEREVRKRLLFIQAIETVRCLDEGVLQNTADANIGSIFGWGFAPFKGGTLQFINDYGVAEFVTEADRLCAAYGERFDPPDRLRRMAQDAVQFS